jgi:GDP-D-mannose dehydratase
MQATGKSRRFVQQELDPFHIGLPNGLVCVNVLYAPLISGVYRAAFRYKLAVCVLFHHNSSLFTFNF